MYHQISITIIRLCMRVNWVLQGLTKYILTKILPFLFKNHSVNCKELFLFAVQTFKGGPPKAMYIPNYTLVYFNLLLWGQYIKGKARVYHVLKVKLPVLNQKIYALLYFVWHLVECCLCFLLKLELITISSNMYTSYFYFLGKGSCSLAEVD